MFEKYTLLHQQFELQSNNMDPIETKTNISTYQQC